MRDIGAAFVYTAGVTSAEFWVEVGKAFRRARLSREIANPGDVKKLPGHGRVTGPTVSSIERGEPVRTNSLDHYAGKLGLSLVDVFNAVLKPTVPDGDPDLELLIRNYRALDPEARSVLVTSSRRMIAAGGPNGYGREH